MATPDAFVPVADHQPQRLRRVGALRRGRRRSDPTATIEFAVGDPHVVDLPALVEQADAGGGDGARRAAAAARPARARVRQPRRHARCTWQRPVRILAGAGLDETALANTADLPLDADVGTRPCCAPAAVARRCR